MPSRISPEAAISEALREEVRSGRATLDRKLAICMEAAVLDPEDRARFDMLTASLPKRVADPANKALALLFRPAHAR